MAGRIDAVALARELIRCPSVTPADAGALDVLRRALEPLGFSCRRLRFEEPGSKPVDNLYARRGAAAPNFCFAGHVDVVPAGDRGAWSRDPFAAEIVDGVLFGRGAADMKGALAAFVAAVDEFLAANSAPCGSISLLITGDEEGPAVNGTRKVLDWMARRGETADVCLVGEPTSVEAVGDTVKIGRRGSLSCTVIVEGAPGHVAYPHLADNPAARLVRMLAAALETRFDDGTAHFQPTALAITSIDIGNPATNVIPARARAAFNIRFNDRHSGESLIARLREIFDSAGGDGVRYALESRLSGEAFLTPPGALSDLVGDAAEAACGRRPALGTGGGTSDARFLKDMCPTVELGLVGRTMHKVDECVAVDDLRRLTAVYRAVLQRYFAP